MRPSSTLRAVWPEPVPVTSANWRKKALAAEAARDLPAAIDFWQKALSAEPQALDIVAHIAGLAARLSQWALAEKFYTHLIHNGQHGPAIIKAYCETLREQSKFDEAIDLLKGLLQERPTEAGLWEVLGTVLIAQGETETALVFLDEALRLSPSSVTARFERSCARYELGHVEDAVTDALYCHERFTDRMDQHSAGLLLAYGHMALGNLSEGWHHYQSRHKRGTQSEIQYETGLPPAEDLIANQKLFVTMEQGLGDEVMFASLLPDLSQQASRLGIAVEPRLVSLFSRSFPKAQVMAHRTRTEGGRISRTFPNLTAADWDGWVIIGDLLPKLRPDVASFTTRPFLKADPDRVQYWRDWLDGLGAGPKVGLLWKSLKFNAQRDRGYAPFAHYKGLMAEAPATFINLQYGDSDAEQAQARADGLAFVTPPGLNLKDDLDDVAALSSAVDLVIAPPNATSTIAAACGTEVWMVTTPVYWPALGQETSPWFPKTRLFATDTLSDWSGVFERIGQALKERTSCH